MSFYLWTILMWTGIMTLSAQGVGFDHVAGEVNWRVGNEEQGTVSASMADAIQSATVTVGNNLKVETAKYFDTEMMKYTPGTSNAGNTEAVMIEYRVKPVAGLTFKPTRVKYAAVKVGTDGATYSWSYTLDGEESTITKADASTTLRNNGANSSTAELYHSIDIAADAVGVFSFRIYISNTADNKNLCFGNITIEGEVDGVTQAVEYHSLEVKVSPEEGGTVTQSPAGKEFESGAMVTLTAQRNFGYRFVSWTDGDGKVLSEESRFSYVVDNDAVVTANFKAIETFELAVDVEAPANDYMVTYAPLPTEVDGKKMYETGTKVTLTAHSNKILAFTGWSNGETTSDISVVMSRDMAFTASYAAADFIAGWDFYLSGNNGRRADFAAEDNDADQLVLRDENGNTSSWLDKSQEAAGGYEGKPAAVNWRTGSQEGDVGHWYYQAMVDASAFTHIVVSAEMLYNYNAYQNQWVEWSADGVNWHRLGGILIEKAKQWTEGTFALPAEADHQKTLSLRWIPDKTSKIDGAASANDGTAITNVFVTGEKNYVDDGKAPVLMSSVPEDGAANVAANGKIVLTFDEKVQADPAEALGTLTAGGSVVRQGMQPVVAGKTMTYEYEGLSYATDYVFTIAEGTVADLTGNRCGAITLHFATRGKPAVAKALYDFVVPDDGPFAAAITAASRRTDTGSRYRIFVKAGAYVIPASATAKREGTDGKQYPDATTVLTAPNVSIIGEDREATVVSHTVPDVKVGGANVLEGIGRGDVLQLQSRATKTYFQDITLKSGMEDATGRNIVLNDQSDKTVCKNVCLWGYQDTYVSNNEHSRFYFEGGLLRGRTDFLCGKGDVYYNAVTLQVCQSGGYVAVPSRPTKYGYIFKDCEIVGEKSGINGNYTLGRPWGNGTPIALYIDTRMKVQPSAVGWNEMSNGWPARFAEYNSMTATGTVIDLSNRKKIFGDNHPNNPVLTAEEAAEMTLARVMGGSDGWDPTAATEQASAPTNVVIEDGVLTWDDNDYVLCWAVVKDGRVAHFTTTPRYIVDDPNATYAVRAANEMGGLGAATTATAADGICTATAAPTADGAVYNLQGQRMQHARPGVCIIGGQKVVVK